MACKKKSGPPASAKILTNRTDSARGITLPGGVIMLGPREIRPLSDREYGELKTLFGSRTFQRFADNGIFRLSGLDEDEESTRVPTPEPPADLAGSAAVTGLAAPVGTGSGTSATAPVVVGHQTGGPLPEDGPERRK